MTQAASNTAQQQLQLLDKDVEALQAGGLGVAAFCVAARGHTALRQALPPRYAQVLDQLLDRLESSALFSEDSCSFSQSDLRANLRLWLDKAHEQLK